MFSVVSLHPLRQSSTPGMNPKCENPEKRNPESGKPDNGPDGEPSPGESQENQEADRIRCVCCSQGSVGEPSVLQIVSKSGLLRIVV